MNDLQFVSTVIMVGLIAFGIDMYLLHTHNISMIIKPTGRMLGMQGSPRVNVEKIKKEWPVILAPVVLYLFVMCS